MHVRSLVAFPRQKYHNTSTVVSNRDGKKFQNFMFVIDSVRVLRRWNWKHVSVVVICYGLTVIVSAD